MGVLVGGVFVAGACPGTAGAIAGRPGQGALRVLVPTPWDRGRIAPGYSVSLSVVSWHAPKGAQAGTDPGLGGFEGDALERLISSAV